MIPTIEQIVEGVKDGSISPSQAVTWLYMHAEGSADDLRDMFAGQAMPEILAQKDVHDGRELPNAAWLAYQVADAMLAERNK